MNLLRALVLLAVAVAAVAFAPNAHADGDPASDYLLTQQVFLPSDATASSPRSASSLVVVQAANRAGFAIRVAIIPSSYDLGSVTELWRRPAHIRPLPQPRAVVRLHPATARRHAQRTRLQLAEPSAVPAYRVLAAIAIPSSNAGLLTAAQTAVRRLAAAAGIASPARAATDGSPRQQRRVPS